MSTVNKFKFVGISKLNGTYTVRYANNKGRKTVLARHGHKDIRFIELSQPEREEDAVDALMKEDWICDNLDVAKAVVIEGMRLGFAM